MAAVGEEGGSHYPGPKRGVSLHGKWAQSLRVQPYPCPQLCSGLHSSPCGISLHSREALASVMLSAPTLWRQGWAVEVMPSTPSLLCLLWDILFWTSHLLGVWGALDTSVFSRTMKNPNGTAVAPLAREKGTEPIWASLIGGGSHLRTFMPTAL